MAYRTLLFDADGTLFDYERAEARALRRTLAGLGYPVGEDTLAVYREVNAAAWQALERGEIAAATLRYRRFDDLFRALELPLDRAAEAAESYLLELGRCSDLLPGAAEIVARLSGRARMAIVTNGLAEVQRSRLSRSPISRHFDAVVISDELGVSKPDRRIIDHALELLGAERRDDALIVGDSLSSDIAAGRNAGIGTCWFAPHGGTAPEHLRPDHTVRRLDEVAALAPPAAD